MRTSGRGQRRDVAQDATGPDFLRIPFCVLHGTFAPCASGCPVPARAFATLPRMSDLAGKHIVLGLTGGIACYKAAELCRAFIKDGATVQVVMTESAGQFITATTMQALSGRTVYTSQW